MALIFILWYQDQNFGHNITTCGFSYSLGDWPVIGVGARENAADQIKHIINSSAWHPDESHAQMEQKFGFISHREKSKLLRAGPRNFWTDSGSDFGGLSSHFEIAR